VFILFGELGVAPLAAPAQPATVNEQDRRAVGR
jgi:hypothetical protein